MQKNFGLMLSACLMATATIHGQNSVAPMMGLKDAYAGKFLIGCAGEMPARYSPEELANVKTHYNIITPENSMKPQPTHPSEDTYSFAGRTRW